MLVFASVTSALVPLVLGGISIVMALGITRAITLVTPMSVYAVNVITILGLGLAIDYSLLMVGRFREELSHDKSVRDALVTTVTSAGRTILFSGLTVILSLLGLLAFPQTFLKSMGLGGAAAVSAAVILALTVLPAILAVLGKKIDFLSLPHRRRTRKEVEHGFWYRFSKVLIQQPVAVFIASLGILLLLGSPFLHAEFMNSDATSLPSNLSSRQVYDALTNNFSGASSEPIVSLVTFPDDALTQANVTALRTYVQTVRTLPGVTLVDSITSVIPSTTPLAAMPATALDQVRGVYVSGDTALVTIFQSYTPQSSDARNLVASIRAIAPPHGGTVLVGGVSAQLVDSLVSLKAHIGYALLIVFLASFVLMFFLIGSIVIPIKAIILNILSLSATFGVLTWIFQGHHLAASLGLNALGALDATSPVLVFSIAFGLAMDYEFFLLSRIKEEHDRTGETSHAVAFGVQKTAGIITSAALLLISVTSFFALSKFSLLEQIGIGLSLAVLIDATIVRLLLVPVTMHLLGSLNWWLPKPLRKLYERVNLHD